ncbi:unnamed protein product [Ectocarpus sp. CCAP 1310/34]|nr:unnamed protein product [Ectocarpus sp. CCAP 1310/34]
MFAVTGEVRKKVHEIVLEKSNVIFLVLALNRKLRSQSCENPVQGVRCTSWDRFWGEGFVVQARARRRRSEEDSTQKYEVTHAPWCKEGTSEDPLFVLRREGFHLNNDNLVVFSAPVVCYNDAFNCFGMGNKAVQRLRRQTHVGTLASTGASCQGEIGLQCEILGLLQRACLGECMLRDDGAISKHELCQVSCLEMLSTQGRRLVSAVVAQNLSLVYPAGTERLKDIVSNYSSLTGSDKWTLQSIMLLVFRPILANVGAMVRFFTLAPGGGRRPLL